MPAGRAAGLKPVLVDTLSNLAQGSEQTEPSTIAAIWELVFRAVWFAVTWLAIPLLLLGLFGFALRILRKIRSREQLTSANAGLWGGVVAAIIVVSTQSTQFVMPFVALSVQTTLNLAFAAIGAVIGFVVLWAIKALLPTRSVGVIVMLLSGTSLVSLYSYFFIATWRPIVFSGSLGIALGVFIHQMIFPKALLQNLAADREAAG